MRIRKNTKVSPLLSTTSRNGGSAPAAELLQTYVCQLNQSPWDVISFDSDPFQFEYNELNFTNCNNGINGDFVGAVDISVPSMMMEKSKMKDVCCEEKPCKKKAKVKGQSLCKRQSRTLDSYNKKPRVAVRRRAKPRAAKKHPQLSSSPIEFYYYSGFGPQWEKRRENRSSRSKRQMNKNNNININSAMVESKKNAEDNNIKADNIFSEDGLFEVEVEIIDDFDYVDDNDDDYKDDEDYNDEDDNDYDDDDYYDSENDKGKKKMRKPVKVRSLKSLM